MTGDAGLGAARLGGAETVPCMAGVALGGHRMALDAGLDFSLRLVGKVGCIHRPLHGQHMTGKAIAGFVEEFTMLFIVAITAYGWSGQVQLLMVAAVTIVTVDRLIDPGMTTSAPVVDNAGRDSLVTLDTEGGLEYSFDRLARLIEIFRVQ